MSASSPSALHSHIMVRGWSRNRSTHPPRGGRMRHSGRTSSCSRGGTAACVQSPRPQKLFFGDALYGGSLRCGTPVLMASPTEAALGRASSFCSFRTSQAGARLAAEQAELQRVQRYLPAVILRSLVPALLSWVQPPAPVTRCHWCKPGAAGGRRQGA